MRSSVLSAPPHPQPQAYCASAGSNEGERHKILYSLKDSETLPENSVVCPVKWTYKIKEINMCKKVKSRLKTIELCSPSSLFLFFEIIRNIMLSMFYHSVKIWQSNNMSVMLGIFKVIHFLIIKFKCSPCQTFGK